MKKVLCSLCGTKIELTSENVREAEMIENLFAAAVIIDEREDEMARTTNNQAIVLHWLEDETYLLLDAESVSSVVKRNKATVMHLAPHMRKGLHKKVYEIPMSFSTFWTIIEFRTLFIHVADAKCVSAIYYYIGEWDTYRLQKFQSGLPSIQAAVRLLNQWRLLTSAKQALACVLKHAGGLWDCVGQQIQEGQERYNSFYAIVKATCEQLPSSEQELLLPFLEKGGMYIGIDEVVLHAHARQCEVNRVNKGMAQVAHTEKYLRSVVRYKHIQRRLMQPIINLHAKRHKTLPAIASTPQPTFKAASPDESLAVVRHFLQAKTQDIVTGYEALTQYMGHTNTSIPTLPHVIAHLQESTVARHWPKIVADNHRCTPAWYRNVLKELHIITPMLETGYIVTYLDTFLWPYEIPLHTSAKDHAHIEQELHQTFTQQKIALPDSLLVLLETVTYLAYYANRLTATLLTKKQIV